MYGEGGREREGEREISIHTVGVFVLSLCCVVLSFAVLYCVVSCRGVVLVLPLVVTHIDLFMFSCFRLWLRLCAVAYLLVCLFGFLCESGAPCFFESVFFRIRVFSNPCLFESVFCRIRVFSNPCLFFFFLKKLRLRLPPPSGRPGSGCCHNSEPRCRSPV